MDLEHLGREPLLVAIAGPNGAVKTTFCQAHLQPAAYRYVNADVLAREFDMLAWRCAFRREDTTCLKTN